MSDNTSDCVAYRESYTIFSETRVPKVTEKRKISRMNSAGIRLGEAFLARAANQECHRRASAQSIHERLDDVPEFAVDSFPRVKEKGGFSEPGWT